MALNELELMDAYQGLIKAFPDDLHIARDLIQMLQESNEIDEARDLAMIMARRMLSLGHSSDAIAFLSICEKLQPPEVDEVESMKTIAELTRSAPGQNSIREGKVFELIEELSDSESRAFLSQARLIKAGNGQDIVKQGEISRNFYLILRGELHVHMEAKAGQSIDLKVLGKGDFFGEFACLYQMPRIATVTASSDVVLLDFTNDAVESLIKHSPFAGHSLVKVVQRRMIESVSFSHPAFAEIAAADRTWLASESELIECVTSDNISQKCHMDDLSFYIVVFGEAVANRNVGGDKLLQCEMKVGAIFGSERKSLGFPLGTTLEVPERCLVCKVPIEIFTSFSIAYPGFEHWVESHVEERNKKLLLLNE